MNYDDQFNQVAHAHRVAQHASARAKWWYDKVWDAYDNMDYALNTPYNGLMLVSIFETKATAYRARPVDQINIGLNDIHPTPEIENPTDDPLHAYYAALQTEKDAWSLYQAAYDRFALVILRDWQRYCDWCTNTGHTLPVRNDQKYARYNSGHFRVLEVKVIK